MTQAIATLPVVSDHDCWNRIGISGDRSCPELEQHIHCRNCPVFARAATAFFERAAPEGYLEEWSTFLSDPVTHAASDDLSVLLFRLEGEWLALPVKVVVEVTVPRLLHRIPHRSNETLVGMVNLRGQLQLMVSMQGLLGVEAETAHGSGGDETGATSRRLVVVRKDGQTWVFAADEVGGVQRFSRAAMQSVPSTLANPASSFSQAVIPWNGRSVGLLDDVRIFVALKGLGR